MSLILREILVVGGRGDDRHQLRPPFGRLANLLKRHAVGLRVELPPVVGDLRVVGELIVVAEVESELLLRRGDAGSARKARQERAATRAPRLPAHTDERMRGVYRK